MRLYIKIYLSFLLLVVVQSSSSGNTIEQDFTSANSLMQNKKYVDALRIYKKIEQDGNGAANLYVNMANAENQLGHIAASLLYLERARKYTRDKQQIDEAIKQIVGSNHLEYERAQMTFMRLIAEQLSLQAWYYMLFVIAFCCVVFIVIYKLKFKDISYVFLGTTTLVYIFSLLMVYLIIYTKKQELNKHEYAIIMSMNYSLKNAPNNLSSTNYEVTEGSKFQIKDKIGNWYLLQNQFGKKGWAESNALGII